MIETRERLRELLDEWRREHGQQRLPIDVEDLASARGIRVEPDAEESLVQRRFTVAQELVHTLLNDAELCDWGASVLLMPDELTWSYRADQGLRAVERLARDAKVSLEAAGLRLVERSGKPAAFVVAAATEHGLCVRYARVREIPALVPRGAQIAAESALARVVASGRRERAVEPLPGGDPHQRFNVEAKSYPTGRGAGTRERVLALAWPSA